jgi:hypothetical protein
MFKQKYFFMENGTRGGPQASPQKKIAEGEHTYLFHKKIFLFKHI